LFFICTKQFPSNILLACIYIFKFVLNYNKYIDIALLDSSFTRCGTLLCNNWCSTVPDSWVLEKESTIWPPKGVTISTAISKTLQSSDAWTIYNQLIGPFGE